MANEIANLKVGTSSYPIKDNTARTTAKQAEQKADQAILDSAKATTAAGEAKSAAAAADTKATNANTKIDGAKITGKYTTGTETLEIVLEKGAIA